MTARDGVDMSAFSPVAFTVSPRSRLGAFRQKNIIGWVPPPENPMSIIEVTQSTAVTVSVFMRDPSTGLGLPGLASSMVVSVSKAGAAFTTLSPVITDRSFGYYSIGLLVADTGTLGMSPVRVTAPTALDNNELVLNVIAINKNDAVHMGLSSLPNAAAGATGGLPEINGSGDIQANVNHWRGGTPANVTGTNGYVQSAVLRWLTDDSPGTPSALVNGGDLNAIVHHWQGVSPNSPVGGNIQADVVTWLGSAPNALVGGDLPADVKQWLGSAPAALTTNGYLQSMVLRWLTDDSTGTPSVLVNNSVPSNVVEWEGVVPAALTSGFVQAATEAINGTSTTAIATAILDATLTGHNTAGTVGAALTSIGSLPSSSQVATAVLDALLSDHSVAGSIGEGIAIAAGLLQGNFFMDETVNTDPNGQTSARMRVFRNGTDAGAATSGGSGEGEFATFTVTTTYSGPNLITTHRVVKD